MHETAVKVLLEMLAGRSSPFYEQLYSEGLLNSSFGTDFSIEKYYAFSAMGGESKDPMKVMDRFCQMVEDARKHGLDKEAYDRLIRSMLGNI